VSHLRLLSAYILLRTRSICWLCCSRTRAATTAATTRYTTTLLLASFPNKTTDLTKTGSGQTQGKFKQTSVVRRMHWRFVPPRKTQRRQEGTAGTQRQELLLLPAAAVARARRQVRSAACLKFVMKSDHDQPRQALDKHIRNSNTNVAFVFAQACR
jgi:hypothetical protein